MSVTVGRGIHTHVNTYINVNIKPSSLMPWMIIDKRVERFREKT